MGIASELGRCKIYIGGAQNQNRKILDEEPFFACQLPKGGATFQKQSSRQFSNSGGAQET